MSIRGFGDAFAFQRLLWMIVGTVIVPTALLALYGVVAIRNERAASSARARVQQQAVLKLAASDLFRELDRVDTEVHSGTKPCAEVRAAPCTAQVAGAARLWVWQQREPLPEELQGVGTPSPQGSETVWFVPSDGGDPIGIFRVDEALVGWQLDVPWFDRWLIERRAEIGDEANVALVARQTGPATPVREFLADFDEGDADRRLPLGRPLAGWELTMTWRDGSLPASRSFATLYVLGLIALLATILIGTVFTLTSTAREIRLSRLQTDFVSHLSHELRTPLTSIQLFIETLQSGRLQDQERIDECLTLLAQESNRLSRRIERVLEWARMEAGRRVYDSERVDVAALINEVLQAYESQTMLKQTAVSIQVDIPEGTPDILGDREALVEALLNLVQNAVKYNSAPCTVHIRAKHDGPRVGLSVEDNGPGIPLHEQKRIFEKFYRADNLLRRETEGSGLGLAIVRAVIHGHGGRVTLDSQLGRGSRFTLWLPSS